MNIMFKTTSSCNANCIYCFDKISQDNKRKLMPLNELKEIFTHLCSWDNYIDWCWHGGEPTLAGVEYMDDAMYAMKEIARDHNVEVRFTIQTNGIVLNQDWFDLFDKYQVGLGMSYDGVNSLQSRGYISQAQKDKLMRNAGLIYIINPFNIDKLIEDYKIINEKGHNLSINWVFPLDGQTPAQIWNNDLETAVQKYLDYLDYYLWDKNGRLYERMAVDWILHSLNKPVDTCVFANCWATDLFGIDYNGKLYKCDEIHRKEISLGNVLDYPSMEEVRQHENIQKQHQCRDKWKETDCKDCEFSPSCMQGCYTRSLSESKGEHPYSFACYLTKKIVPHIYNQISDLSPEEFLQLNPIVKDTLIKWKYVPASLKEKYLCQQ